MTKFNLEFIKVRRKELGITSGQMAQALGFKNPSTYWKHENGQHKFKADMIPLLAKILHCEPQNFFTNDPPNFNAV